LIAFFINISNKFKAFSSPASGIGITALTSGSG